MGEEKKAIRGAAVRWPANVRRRLVELVCDEDGTSAIEYGLVAALIVLAASTAIASLGGGVEGFWTQLSARLVATFNSAVK